MSDLGVDIGEAKSKPASQFVNESFDIVVTVCDSAAEDCPAWPGAKRIEHWSIEDPSYGPDDPATRYDRFIEKRDELRRKIDELLKSL
jgi:arsenate reductase